MKKTEQIITVKPLEGYPALVMTWHEKINKADLKPAFEQILAALQTTETPLYVVVDLSSNPNLPIIDTMKEALRGVFRHPRLAEWLVYGFNREALWIGGLLTQATRRDNIQWFNSFNDVLAYLDSATN